MNASDPNLYGKLCSLHAGSMQFAGVPPRVPRGLVSKPGRYGDVYDVYPEGMEEAGAAFRARPHPQGQGFLYDWGEEEPASTIEEALADLISYEDADFLVTSPEYMAKLREVAEQAGIQPKRRR